MVIWLICFLKYEKTVTLLLVFQLILATHWPLSKERLIMAKKQQHLNVSPFARIVGENIQKSWYDGCHVYETKLSQLLLKTIPITIFFSWLPPHQNHKIILTCRLKNKSRLVFFSHFLPFLCNVHQTVCEQTVGDLWVTRQSV